MLSPTWWTQRPSESSCRQASTLRQHTTYTVGRDINLKTSSRLQEALMDKVFEQMRTHWILSVDAVTRSVVESCSTVRGSTATNECLLAAQPLTTPPGIAARLRQDVSHPLAAGDGRDHWCTRDQSTWTLYLTVSQRSRGSSWRLASPAKRARHSNLQITLGT